MAASTNNPSNLETALQDMSTGLSNTTLSLLASMVLAGASLAKAEVIAKLKAYLQLLGAVDSTKQAYSAAVAARRAATPDIRSFYDGLVDIVKQAVGPTNQGVLSTFGILPPKPRKAPTAETKALAKFKAQATWQARSTKGKNQKLAIKPVTNVSLVLSSSGTPAVAREAQ